MQSLPFRRVIYAKEVDKLLRFSHRQSIVSLVRALTRTVALVSLSRNGLQALIKPV